MSKMNELSQTVDELKTAANMLLSVANSLLDLFSGTGEVSNATIEPKKQPAVNKEKLTLEMVRAVLAEKSRNGYTDEIKALLEKHGASKLSEIDPKKYKKLLEEVKVLGNE
ncbi:DNA ligase [Acidilutibacter cellobiosedens]|uniref:DNA ligase n=1 Tax=Acidilutibacter cellobiosedens TaxID=2507161 RepID=A0A410QFY6_9FIRM|nr:DNA ligase [Acidilutibacter cellobiosedens]QAT62983.1 DNA ligase [Acidilutibacter cellobiosedens]